MSADCSPAALACPSVVISCGADASRWAPLDTDRHRVLWQAMPCRPCAHAVCPIGHPCAEAISVDAVLAALRSLVAVDRHPDLAHASESGRP